MYCPRCGQKRISDETIFCSRCGLLLDHIEDVMQNDGEPLFLTGTEGGLLGRLVTGRNVRLLALSWFVIVTMMLLPIAAILDVHEEALGILGLMGPMAALFLLVLSFFLPKSASGESQRQKRREKKQEGSAQPRELPPDRTQYVSDFVPPSVRNEEDAEFASRKPPSVTEDTTRHLKRSDED